MTYLQGKAVLLGQSVYEISCFFNSSCILIEVLDSLICEARVCIDTHKRNFEQFL
jgi:hypothetical protein